MLRTMGLLVSKVIITDKQLIDKEISSDLIIYELPIFIKNIIIEYNDIKVIHLCEELQNTTSWGTDFKNYRDEFLKLFCHIFQQNPMKIAIILKCAWRFVMKLD